MLETAFGQPPYVAELRRLGSRGRAGQRPAAEHAAGAAPRAESAVRRDPHAGAAARPKTRTRSCCRWSARASWPKTTRRATRSLRRRRPGHRRLAAHVPAFARPARSPYIFGLIMVGVIALGLIFGLSPLRRAARLQRAHVLPRRGVHAARNAQPGHVRAAVRLDLAGQLARLLRHPVQRDAGGVPRRASPIRPSAPLYALLLASLLLRLPDPAGRVPVDRLPAAALRRGQPDRVSAGLPGQPGLRRLLQPGPRPTWRSPRTCSASWLAGCSNTPRCSSATACSCSPSASTPSPRWSGLRTGLHKRSARGRATGAL